MTTSNSTNAIAPAVIVCRRTGDGCNPFSRSRDSICESAARFSGAGSLCSSSAKRSATFRVILTQPSWPVCWAGRARVRHGTAPTHRARRGAGDTGKRGHHRNAYRYLGPSQALRVGCINAFILTRRTLILIPDLNRAVVKTADSDTTFGSHSALLFPVLILKQLREIVNPLRRACMPYSAPRSALHEHVHVIAKTLAPIFVDKATPRATKLGRRHKAIDGRRRHNPPIAHDEIVVL